MTTNTDDVTWTRDLVAYEKALRFEWRVKRAGKERAFPFACSSRVNPNLNGKLLLQAIRPGMSFHRGGCGKLFQLLPHKISFNRLLKRTLLRQTLNLQLNKLLLLTCPFSKQFLGLKGKHFNPKSWHLQNFTYLLPKPMPYISDLRVDVGVVTGIFAFPTFHTLVTLGMTPSLFHLFLFSSFIPPWECPDWKPFLLLPQVNFLYSWGGNSIHLGWRGLTVWGNRLVLYLELEKELTVLIYDNDLCYVGSFTWISNPINCLCNLQKENSFSNYLLFQGL